MLSFIINNHEKFIINIDCPDNIIHSCNFSKIDLVIKNDHIIIGKSIVDDYAQVLKNKLTLALSNELKLHPSIEKNIGYYWNQDLNEEKPDLFMIKGKEESYWVGGMHFLWATDSSKKNQQYATWLYNDALGNIIFEVTPTYPDTFIDPEDPADVQAYQEWMEKKYKPFFTRIISRETAIQWLDQADMLLKILN
ncbi:MAG: hypothetical protein JO129_01290 [Candidatus Dependentiae bacterium]|nr:hypothetical protein [Candidatus Dependentiae bacterium]